MKVRIDDKIEEVNAVGYFLICGIITALAFTPMWVFLAWVIITNPESK